MWFDTAKNSQNNHFIPVKVLLITVSSLTAEHIPVHIRVDEHWLLLGRLSFLHHYDFPSNCKSDNFGVFASPKCPI